FKPQRILTVPENLHRHLFRSDVPSTSSAEQIPIQLPKLRSPSLQEHFRAIHSRSCDHNDRAHWIRAGCLERLIVDTARYCWCSERLVHLTPVPLLARLEHLIPLGGSEKPRVAIGHNVGYDRARAREPYEKK
ncbi:hypothetical protein OSTOST_16798, partial [Ostertagia ostertagi]